MMNEVSRNMSHSKLLHVALVVFGLLSLCGCQDWPDERATGIEAQNILRDLGRIEPVSDTNIPGPAIYKSPPKKLKQMVGGAEEWKLIYFCRYHTAAEMKQIISEQFATKLFDEKGKSTQVTDYTVTANPATNQLIVRCPLEADVDAVLEVINEVDIPPVQVRIDCLVSELYADLTVDRETSMLIENLFGEIKLSGQESNNNLAFPGAELRDPARAKFGLKIGVNREDFTALVDILVSRGYMKILMNPSLEVVNGETARIQSKQHQPLQQITVQSGGFGGVPVLTTQTEYYDIIDSLQITPHVYADGYIGLETEAQIAAYLTPEGIKQTPNVTERTITNKDNRIRLGESLVIGGIRKSEKRDVIRGVPILKDIPGLNILFSGRDFEERATEVIFILTPTISTGGKSNRDTVDEIRHRHSSPVSQNPEELLMDPLGVNAREQERQRQLEAARQAQQQSEAEKAAARLEAFEATQRINELTEQLEQAKGQTEENSAEAEPNVQTAKEQPQIEVRPSVGEAKPPDSQAPALAPPPADDLAKQPSTPQPTPAETPKQNTEAKVDVAASQAKTKPQNEEATDKTQQAKDTPAPQAPATEAPKADAQMKATTTTQTPQAQGQKPEQAVQDPTKQVEKPKPVASQDQKASSASAEQQNPPAQKQEQTQDPNDQGKKSQESQEKQTENHDKTEDQS
jgi:Flp pilus assembly secretin CpaC